MREVDPNQPVTPNTGVISNQGEVSTQPVVNNAQPVVNNEPVANTQPVVDNTTTTQDKKETNTNNDLPNYTSMFTKDQIEKGKVMGIISYISVIALVVYFLEKNNPYVQFHAKQGLNLFIYEAIFYSADAILSGFLPFFGFIAYIGEIALAVLSLFGIVYAINGEARGLPVIDKIAIVK
jgi:uncharacterized membrane protein